MGIALLALSSCAGFRMTPIRLVYSPKPGVTITENIGDGVLGLTVDVTKPIDLGGGRYLQVFPIEPAK